MKVLSFDVGTKNLAFCKLEVLDKQFTIHDWQVLSVVSSDINVNKTPIEDLVIPFANVCRTHVHDWLVDTEKVFIEMQPMGRGARNLKTKILSHILQVLLQHERDVPIQFIHPSLKLKDMPGKHTYRENKKYAVAKTEELLGGSACLDPKAKDLFVGRKRDDLADAFLQGYYGTEGTARVVTEKRPRKKTKRTEINEQ
jgi:hypothetical protein